MKKNLLYGLVLFLGLALLGGCTHARSRNSPFNPLGRSETSLNAEQKRVFLGVQQPISVNITPLSSEVLALHPEMSVLPGQWWGVYDYDGMGFVVTIEEVNLDSAKFFYCWDGPRASCNQVYGHIVGKGKIKAILLNGAKFTLTLSKSGNCDIISVTFQRTDRDAFLTSTLVKAE